MNTRKEINDWLATATPDDIAARIERAETEAFLWHVAVIGSGPEHAAKLIEATLNVAQLLIKGGYQRPDTP